MNIDAMVIRCHRLSAERLRQSARWDEAHIDESFTTNEYIARMENNRANRREARALDHAAEHYMMLVAK